jgi:SAM-dependent methyltransferase
MTTDFASITNRQRDTWSLGDFNTISLAGAPVGEAVCDAIDLGAGARVLDVACGSGTAALAAARRHAEVHGLDFVPALIDRAKQRAAAEGTTIDFVVGDAQALPYPDASFDAIVSVFGVMFAPDQAKAAAELLRVAKPGARIGLACWMPEGFGGDFFRTIAKHAPPPPGLTPPVRWGTREGIEQLFGDGVRDLRLEPRVFHQHYRSLEHCVEIFLAYFGPAYRAMSLQTDDAGRAALRADVTATFAKFDVAKGTPPARVRCEYAMITATRA